MRAFFKRYGDPVRLRFQSDPVDPDAFLVVVHEVAPTQHRWSREIAHILYDLRSALDQTVWQLYVAANRRDPPPQLGRKLAFPICTSRRLWANELKRGRLAGLDQVHVAEIERVQPYRIRRHASASLTRLAGLNDMDKHREPSVVLCTPLTFRIEAQPVNCAIVGIDQLHILNRPLRVHARLARVRFAPSGTGQPSVHVYCVGGTVPAFENGVPVEGCLETILSDVRNIVTRFATLS